MTEHVNLTLHLIEHLKSQGIDTVVIGGVALAYHGYERATRDIDLGVFVDFSRLVEAMSCFEVPDGFCVATTGTTNADDPLGGVISIGYPTIGGLDIYIQVVNFNNPLRLRRSPTRLIKPAIAASQIDDETHLPFIPLTYLVLLKLIAGSAVDLMDVRNLMMDQSEDVFDEIQQLAGEFGLSRKYNAHVAPLNPG